MSSRRHVRSAPLWAPLLLGAFIGLLGLALMAWGAWVMSTGGPGYFLPAGLCLLTIAALLTSRRLPVLWLYALFFAMAFMWALWEFGLANGWSQPTQLLALSALLAIALAPLLRIRSRSWLPAVGASTAAIFVATVVGLFIANRPATRDIADVRTAYPAVSETTWATVSGDEQPGLAYPPIGKTAADESNGRQFVLR